MLESKLFKVFVSLGVPGLALGVFYMLFRTFSWEFPIVPSTWVGPIIVLFMLFTSGVVFYALTLWRPQRHAAATAIDATTSGAVALHDVLELMHVFLQREADKLETQHDESDSSTEQREHINAAKSAVERAANHTRHYIAKRRRGKRDRNTELELSDKWIGVGKRLRDIDTAEARNLYQICFSKGRYWSDTDGWDDSYAGGQDISLENVLHLVQEITSRTHTG